MLSKSRSIYGNNVLLLKYKSEREREGGEIENVSITFLNRQICESKTTIVINHCFRIKGYYNIMYWYPGILSYWT